MPTPPQELTDEELSSQLADCRITLESIRPYRCREVSARQRALRDEAERRRLEAKGREIETYMATKYPDVI